MNSTSSFLCVGQSCRLVAHGTYLMDLDEITDTFGKSNEIDTCRDRGTKNVGGMRFGLFETSMTTVVISVELLVADLGSEVVVNLPLCKLVRDLWTCKHERKMKRGTALRVMGRLRSSSVELVGKGSCSWRSSRGISN
jgi:hypothetical protein